MKIWAPQPLTYGPAWSNCSFRELMRKWARMKESFGCCIPSRNAISFSLLWAIISRLKRNTVACARAPIWNSKHSIVGVLCLGVVNNTASDQTCFLFHHQISWHDAWVTHQECRNEKLCCETTQQLKRDTSWCFFQLHHNGFNYSSMFCKAIVLQMAAGMIICLLFVTGCFLALWTVISAGEDAVILETSITTILPMCGSKWSAAAFFCPSLCLILYMFLSPKSKSNLF